MEKRLLKKEKYNAKQYAKDQKRIEHDIDDTADHHTDHGNFHPAHRLEDLLKTDRDRVWNDK